MRLFGKLAELSTLNLRADTFEIVLGPNVATTYTADMDLELPPIASSDVLVSQAAIQPVSNKTIASSKLLTSTLIGDSSTPSKEIAFDLSGATTTTRTTIIASQTANRSLTLPDETGTILTTASPLNPAGAVTLIDENTSIVDNSDATKILKFEASGITTATTRTLTIPDASGSILLNDNTAPVSNKTLGTSNIINAQDTNFSLLNSVDATKIAKFSSTLITTGTTRTYSLPDASGDILLNTNIASVTNKSFQDSTTEIFDNSDTTKRFKFEASGITTATTRTLTIPDADIIIVGTTNSQSLTNKNLASSTNVLTGATAASLTTATGGYTITLPAIASTTLLGTNTAQVVTSKDIDGGTASDTSRLTIPKNTKSNLDGLTRKEATLVFATDLDKLYVDDGSLLKEIGGGGSGGINYLATAGAAWNFEDNNTTGWATYADAAGVAPVDGTGGSPNVTFAATATTPLRGTYSGLLTKDAANRQGQGVSVLVSVPLADRGKQISYSFDSLASANFVSGDVIVYAYDVTNGLLLSQSQAVSSGQSTTKGWYLTSTTTAQVRICIHVATTNALDYSLEVDEVTTGPQTFLQGASFQDWTKYPATLTGFGTVTVQDFWFKITQDGMSIRGTFTTGTPTAATASASLPLSVDYTKVPGTTYPAYGRAYRDVVTPAANKDYSVIIASANNNLLLFSIPDTAGAASPLAPQLGNTITGAGSKFSVQADNIPIIGYGSSTQLAARALEEYAADDGTNDVFGPNGTLVPNVAFTTGVTTRDFSFVSPQNPTDSLVLEYNDSGNTGWVPASGLWPYSRGNNNLATNHYGTQAVWISSTVFRVVFGNQGTSVSTSTTSNGQSAWSAQFSAGSRWRVRKVASGAGVGFPIGSRNVVADTSGTAVPTGLLGAVTSSSVSSVAGIGTTVVNLATLTLQPGTYDLDLKAQFITTAGTVPGRLIISISTTSATEEGTTTLTGFNSATGGTAASNVSTMTLQPLVITAPNTVVYATARAPEGTKTAGPIYFKATAK